MPIGKNMNSGEKSPRNKFLFPLYSFAIVAFCAASLSAFEFTLDEPAWVYIGKAKKLIGAHENGKALAVLHELIAVETNNADAHVLLGDIYFNESQYDMAVAHYKAVLKYRRALSIPAQVTDVYFKLLECYATNRDPANLEKTQNEIIALAKQQRNEAMEGELYFFLGEYWERYNNDQSALTYYTLSFEKGYRQKISLYRTAIVYRKRGDYAMEKKFLIESQMYTFDFESAENDRILSATQKRLVELKDVPLPRRPR